MKKTLITLAAFILSILAVAYTVFSQRTQTDQGEITITPNVIPEREVRPDQEQSQKSPQPSPEAQTPRQEEEPPAQEPKKSAFHITREDCSNECENFTQNSSGWRYCANRCDIIPVQEENAQCDTKTGLSKDYCLRDAAIKQNNPSGCDEISDRGIAQQCSNKIIESLVDGF